MNKKDRIKRLEAANQLIKVISECGREFFKHEGIVSTLELSESGRVFFVDYYTRKRIYTHYDGRWNGFTSGGTLKRFIECLRDYITKNEYMSARYFDIDWGDGFKNPWGYDEDILKVQKAAVELGIARSAIK